jgi:hypothetical protein
MSLIGVGPFSVEWVTLKWKERAGCDEKGNMVGLKIMMEGNFLAPHLKTH